MARSDREKQLIAEYKERPKKIGAYCIHNTKDEKRFVGVSRDIDARLNRHQFMLRNGSEQQLVELQKDWQQLGAEYFKFSVLDLIEPPDEGVYDPTEDLDVLLELWLAQLQPFLPDGYNRAP